jgi:Zn-dependent protease with chaperone function
MEGESGHSNCFVDSNRVVIYDSMFEHVRERKHMIAILRHEMGHEVNKHVRKMVIARVVYYNIIFIAFSFFVKYKESWLRFFGITYNSLFLAVFVIIHFIHFKICYYLYEIFENWMIRNFEFQCDQFAFKGYEDLKQDFREAMLIVFQKN